MVILFQFNLDEVVVRFGDNHEVLLEFKRVPEILTEFEAVALRLEEPPEGATSDVTDEIAPQIRAVLWELSRLLRKEAADLFDGGNGPPSLH